MIRVLWCAVVVGVLAGCAEPAPETDPLFTASPAGSTSPSDVSRWNQAHSWGDHAQAGYVKTESDPTFGASPAASITNDNVLGWNSASAVTLSQSANWSTAYGWGNHQDAGYLTAELEPAFTSSAAASITATDVTDWSAAYGWGDHAAAGYLTAEVDPKFGSTDAGALAMFDGTKLVDSSLFEKSGNIGLGTETPGAKFEVAGSAKLGVNGVQASKACTVAGSAWTNWRSSVTACSNYCAGQNYPSASVSPSGSKSCGGSTCAYTSDFGTCAQSTIPNNGFCDSCSTTFTCNCIAPTDSVFTGKVAVGGASASSELSVGGYLQVDRIAGTPPATDCDAAAERGRMKVDPASNQLWVCMNSGWVAK